MQCIRIEEGQFFFYLNPPVLSELQIARNKRDRISLPESLLQQLPQVLFVNGTTSQSALTFCTYYVEPQSDAQVAPEVSKLREKGQIIIRTVLSLDGEMIHQVDRSYLSHSHCLELVRTHHWLISQVTGNLQIVVPPQRLSHQRLPWAIAILLVGVGVTASVWFNLANTLVIVASVTIGLLLLYPVYKLIQAILTWLNSRHRKKLSAK